MKVALLSNVNMDPVNRILRGLQDIKVYDSQGYGNELGILLNKESPLYAFKPEIIFVVIDVMETICHNLEIKDAKNKIDEWFALFESAINEDIVYYVSDAYLYGFEMEMVWDKCLKHSIETIWLDDLQNLIKKHSNVRLLPYSEVVQKIGETNTFSVKMWYMGKILHFTAFHKALAEEIEHKVDLENRTAKKVLLLDLDNTLWRGLAGEHDITPIVLSEDGIGLSFKNFQRAIKQLKAQGVILGIVSKNNEEDAMKIIENHPHMVLRPDDFAVKRINWENKAENIVQIAQDLNLGLDAIVFIDDSQAERALVKDALPEVMVPDFPDGSENLTAFIAEIYHSFFEKVVITDEDREKTAQYQANNERKKLLNVSMDFDGYLDSLEMKLCRVNPEKNKERLVQLINKTNQFNLTTERFSEQEISGILDNRDYEVFLYRVIDRFGDNGIVAAAISQFGQEAVVTEFTLSCRVMGRKIEYAIIEDIENAARARGYDKLIGVYKPTEKNKPVRDLYTSFGYEHRKNYDDGTVEYTILLGTNLTRKYHVDRLNSEDIK